MAGALGEVLRLAPVQWVPTRPSCPVEFTLRVLAGLWVPTRPSCPRRPACPGERSAGVLPG